MSDESDFWSRRRAGVEAERVAAELEEAQPEPALEEEKTDEEVLSELNLPDPELLTKGDDFSAFMAKAVPEHLRRRALRVLWRSDPALANLDMLVDYGEDFTDSALKAGSVQTAYQVGKGMLEHIEKMARDAEALGADDAVPRETDPPLPDHEEVPLSADAVDARDEPDRITADIDTEAGEPEEISARDVPIARRMKFRTGVRA